MGAERRDESPLRTEAEPHGAPFAFDGDDHADGGRRRNPAIGGGAIVALRPVAVGVALDDAVQDGFLILGMYEGDDVADLRALLQRRDGDDVLVMDEGHHAHAPGPETELRPGLQDGLHQPNKLRAGELDDLSGVDVQLRRRRWVQISNA